MSQQEIYERATADAEAKVNKKLDDFQASEAARKSNESKIEVAKFAKSKPDFEQVRPTMYGLSLDAKYANASLQELYDAAKARAGEIAGVTDEQKKRSKAAGGEKPGKTGSNSQTRDKKYTPDSAAEEAWEEVVGSEGLGSI